MGPTDPIAVAYCASRAFLVVCAGLRVTVCVFHGLDLEGLVALVVLVAALLGPARRDGMSPARQDTATIPSRESDS
jgi:hypothetical protein